MMTDYKIPESIQQQIAGRKYTIDVIGKSDSQVICFEDMVLKIEAEREESKNEYTMLKWLSVKLPVPEIICYEIKDGMQYILMSKLNGRMSCDPEYIARPQELVHYLAEGLKMLWSVNTDGCPYRNDLENKFRLADERVRENRCDMEDLEPGTYGEGGFEGPAELLKWLKENKPKEDFVFSHGDYCEPNVFIKDGKVSGFLDLGNAGIADRWQDIALCVRSMEHNIGKNTTYEKQLFEELGMEPDWKKIRYYILLDELF